MSKIENIAPEGMYLRYRLRALLNPANWWREFRWDRQRKQRGWSDRDTWGGGEYILEVVSGVLKKLGDKHSHIDWDQYFITNYPNNMGYESLAEVAADIDSYLAFDRSNWIDTLGFEVKHGSKELPNGNSEMISLNTPEEERLISTAVKNYQKQWKLEYKKAKRAMVFVAVNFPHLWD
jgi:hypothetical protein